MDYEQKMKQAEAYAEKVKQKQELYKTKHQNDKKNKIPTHKLVTFYLFVLLNVVLVYALVAMWCFQDLTHLGLIITDVVGQLLTFLIYSKHSTAQNSEGGIQYLVAQEEFKRREMEYEDNIEGM